MNRAPDNLKIAGILAVVVIFLALLGYHFLSGPKLGEKPHLDPHISRMYPGTGPTNSATQGR